MASTTEGVLREVGSAWEVMSETVSEPVVSVTLRLQVVTKGLQMTLPRFPPAAATSSDAREFADGEDHIGGDLEVLSDAQGQVEAGAVLSALQVSDRLVVDAEGIGEFATDRKSTRLN